MLSNLSEEYKEKLKTIKNHFGEDAQNKKLIEEMEEFKYEVEKCRQNSFILRLDGRTTYISKILEELTDCCVVAEQINKIMFLDFYFNLVFTHYFDDSLLFMNLYSIYQNIILEIARQKIDRTLERIKTGYYSKPEKCPECNGKGSIRLPYGRTVTKCKKCDGSGTKEKGVVDSA